MGKIKPKSTKKLRVGQKVFILPLEALQIMAIAKSPLRLLFNFGYNSLTNPMFKFCGKLVTIKKLTPNSFFIEEDNCSWSWYVNWIDTNVNNKTVEILYGTK